MSTIWTADAAALQINSATTASQVIAALNTAIAQLPACAVPCLAASVPDSFYTQPLNDKYFEFVCNNPSDVVPRVDSCITASCAAAAFDAVSDILNLQPAACLKLQQFYETVNVASA
ncbi:UNVERIFIED_CONTAM: hypothetical protein HDU68_008240 [Siphonaria sp. JEL0065]|nr:hypothetical protein HDU68_008240 [Siphonaria sp. JEL0065]